MSIRDGGIVPRVLPATSTSKKKKKKKTQQAIVSLIYLLVIAMELRFHRLQYPSWIHLL